MNQMQYRKLPHGEKQISILGLGTSSIQVADEREIEDTIRYAVECGINFFDMASAEVKPFVVCGRALASERKKVYFQIHFGADYAGGTYGWTINLDKIRCWMEKTVGIFLRTWKEKTIETKEKRDGFKRSKGGSSKQASMGTEQNKMCIECILELY